MKKLSYFSVVLIFLVVLFNSCSNNENQPLNNEATNSLDLKRLVEDYNNKEFRTIPAIYFEGNIDFGISDENLVLLIGNSGNYESAFKIQLKEGQLQNLKNLKAGNYQLGYLVNELILSNEKTTLYFALDNLEKKLSINSDEYDVAGIIKWKKDNLKTRKNLALKVVDEEASCTCVSVLEQNPPTCHSGGPGATQCSQGECSVSCGSGHYACCNP